MPSGDCSEVRILFLALDTATDTPSLALGTAGSPGEEIRLPSRRDLSRDIERVTGELLAARGTRVADLGGVIVADGPGSFTGLRIGIAFAKGLCRAARLPLATAPSLLGAACAVSGGEGTVVASYDALRGDAYRAVYRFGAGAVTTLAPPALAPAGGAAAPPPLGARPATEADASAAALLRLLALDGGSRPVADPDAWEPIYGRLAEAEARRRASPNPVPRLLRRTDVERVAAIEREAFSDPWPSNAFLELLAQPHVRAYALDDEHGRLLAYAFAAVAADEGEILNFAVAPDERRRGLGKSLLSGLLDMFRREGVAAVHLEVRESNEAAISLYRRAGFRPVGTRRRYYRRPAENALTMTLEMPSKHATK